MYDPFQDEQDLHELKVDHLLMRVRSSVFSKLRRDWPQWRSVSGNGRAKLTQKTQDILDNIAAYYMSSEGIIELIELGIDPPENGDDIMIWVQCADTYDEWDDKAFKWAWANHGVVSRRKRKKLIGV